MISLLIALILQGYVSNHYGRIGVKVDPYGYITKVYDVSPAKRHDLRVGDRIVLADGRKGNYYIDGIAGTTALLKVRRSGAPDFNVTVERVIPEEVYDIE